MRTHLPTRSSLRRHGGSGSGSQREHPTTALVSIFGMTRERTQAYISTDPREQCRQGMYKRSFLQRIIRRAVSDGSSALRIELWLHV